LGRKAVGGDAIALLYLDNPICKKAISELGDTGLFQSINPLEFSIS
jgi:D-3-phosphoglycerate dehydrogenase